MVGNLPLLRPFSALYPRTEAYAEAVAAPPYDILDSEEARLRAINKPYSFLRVSKAEIDLPRNTDPYTSVVYSKAAENLNALVEKGVLVLEKKPCFYIYRLTSKMHSQTGIAGAATVSAYSSGRIRRHELTYPEKEEDRTRHVIAVNAHTSPVLAAYQEKEQMTITTLVKRITSNTEPLFTVRVDNETSHTIWKVIADDDIARLSAAFETIASLYIADGHHRSAAAVKVATYLQGINPFHLGNEMYNSFLLVAFPTREMQILAYHQVIHGLNGMNTDSFLSRIEESCTVIPSIYPVRPVTRGEIGLYMGKRWYSLLWRKKTVTANPVASLDIFLLAKLILESILGIADPRRDERINFMNGTCTLEVVEQMVDKKEETVAFTVYPPSFDELIAVTDANLIMPPKSTWFEPKLADGLLSLQFL